MVTLAMRRWQSVVARDVPLPRPASSHDAGAFWLQRSGWSRQCDSGQQFIINLEDAGKDV
jgi:hypothetical protein